MFFGSGYFLYILLPGLALTLWAQFKVKSTFRKYAQVGAQSGLSGAEAAAEMLRRSGIHDVTIEEVGGFLSDHYDPSKKALRLSPDVYHGRSLASLGVAAHEAGHAIQHATSYAPLSFRSLIVKPAMIGSYLSNWILMFGLMLNSLNLVWVGILLFSFGVLFSLITLPVELNASRRAVQALRDTGMIRGAGEVAGTSAVLNAAALTYVAAAVQAVMQLVYFLWRAGFFGGNDD
jgi:Zn-dependent membrane protease YugP